MNNQTNLSEQDMVIVSALTQGTLATIKEVKTSRENHSIEIDQIALRINLLEDKMICQDDIVKLEQNLKDSISSMLDYRIEKLENNFKTYINENVVMKSELHNSTQATIKWVNENTVTKRDILKLENALLWKLVGFISAIVALTAYIIKH
ncbi:hypothetical protein [Haemophilus influenzae]|uniref:hypothetical protein n=1 Tax=Haemophilus influenzae TaxID=727 RepID=UPI0010A5389C|nr:hypothetical protein [Haemophilus influenzae]MCK9009684.1 hypothetical protein [Haemophilus influenzae]MCK9011372.1 hypothetical protein [Haemophilus influenzae]MCK9060096.1 hypothetical protein [Haemophilus influenzae]